MANIEQRTSNFLEWYKENQARYSEFAQFVLDKMLNALKERAMLHAYHSSRAKTLASLTDKCGKRIYDDGTKNYILKYNDPRNQITDLAGVRIVCYLPQDIVPVQHIVENMFIIDKKNSNNKIELLESDKVGYLSVHYVVSLKEDQLSTEQRRYKEMKCEIQLRTVLQDAWSQVFHDRQYKNNMANTEIPAEMIRETNLVSGALELLDNEIERLVKRYDDLAKRINNAIYQELLDCAVDKDSLERYFRIKFVRLGTRFFSYDDISNILNKYGIITIRDIDMLFDDGLIHAIYALNIQLTIDKILMYGMIVNNTDKFFEIEENKEIIISQEAYKLLEKFIDIRAVCKKYSLQVKEG
ncbi:MAG: hypothetical protein HDR19_08140 [Lachnospiraceae bacterium]|nr:hypothetical protein [Lachnospiraceae bacterium]